LIGKKAKMIITRLHKLALLIPFLYILASANAQPGSVQLNWQGVQTELINGVKVNTLNFTNATNADQWGTLPVYIQKVEMPAPGLAYEFDVTDPVFSALEINPDEIEDIDLISDKPEWETEIVSVRGSQSLYFKLLPIKYNPETGQYEKLMSFNLEKKVVPANFMAGEDQTYEFAETSVLATGDWFKISVEEEGIHQVTWNDLDELGVNTSGLQSDYIALYGNGGGMLPQRNADPRDDDLIENAIMVFDGDDGTFDPGDYFLFYGESPHEWVPDEPDDVFLHTKNLYTNQNFYFITIGQEPGKRIMSVEQSGLIAEKVLTTYNDYAVHEKNDKSLIKSGIEWYGEEFNEITEQEFFFPFPNRDITQEINIEGDFAARSTSVSSFSVFINQDSVFSDNVSAIPANSITKFANPSSESAWFMADETQDLTVKLKLNKKEGVDAIGWLNYLQLNVKSHLQFDGNQFGFRNFEAHKEGFPVEFRINGTSQSFVVWDVTDPHNPIEIVMLHEQGTSKFTIASDHLMEFWGFNGTDHKRPGLEGSVENQNLHGLTSADFIIVTHPDFADQANRLKEIHEEVDGMEVIVADLYEIYNEFASGAPDITAIRDFVRMIYTRSDGKLKYLLLFGDGSYDPLDRLDYNLSFIPTFQSNQSLWYTSTYVTDDYFGLMDPEEGKDAFGNVDLGIGRFAVNTPEEAKLMVDKVENYMHMSPQIQGSWRNSLTFIADDEDNNLHLYQADTILVARIQKKNSCVNINKIYLDAYRQQTSASGHTYPEVNNDINKQVNEGTLIVNYTGHGGELGLAHEKVVQISDILSWDNWNTQPVFVTATCEFSRFDNPGLTSAGELVLLNSNGGGIALYTTTRLAFASSNLLLNKRLYDTLFRAYPNHVPRLGDLMMFSKTPSNTNIRNFVLLGNPALKLAFPGYKIVADSINGVPVDQFTDTLNANGNLTVSGHIESYTNQGEIINDFNGTIYPKLFDKPTVVKTLGNDPRSFPFNFEAQNSILYKGKATVKDGRFKFSFVLPMDISYQFGVGKLSFYAADSLRDANGYFDGLIIGGINQDATADQSGPGIELYLNDPETPLPEEINPNPVLFARLSDPSGINFTGNGIGHDIMLTLNGDTYNAKNLNSLFEPSMDDYTSGSIVLPFSGLPNGEHILELKAWDMFNNSSTATITFTVADSIGVDLMEVYNYPNPFDDYTWFTFNHNQFEGDLSVEIEIYNFYGQHVRTIGPEKVFTNGYAIEPVYWNGDSDGGAKLQPGIYFYTLKVTNEQGHSTERIQKMIISE
jgi:hypothetical protein